MPTAGAAREELLDRCVAYLRQRGLSDASLREIAAGMGTSHRMLIYHFGTRERLLADVVGRIEAAQREALVDLFVQEDDLAEIGRRFWRRLSDPALAPAERLFFEIFSHALYERPWTAQFRASVVAGWVGPLTDLLVRRGYPEPEAALRARLGLAATRGLLMDLLVTGDREILDDASDLLSRLFTAPGQLSGVRPDSPAAAATASRAATGAAAREAGQARG